MVACGWLFRWVTRLRGVLARRRPKFRSRRGRRDRDGQGDRRQWRGASQNCRLGRRDALVSYTARPEKSYNGTIWIARSTDGGKSFSAPQPLIDGAGQRFDIFVASPKGRLYAAWLDKRDAEEARKAGTEFAGSGIAVGWSDDSGKTFASKKILLDHSCECCRVSAALDRDGLPVFAWRHVFGTNLRDHYVAKLWPMALDLWAAG